MKAKKLPSGNYRVQVLVGHDKDGKRIMKSFTAAEEWQALKKAAEYVSKRHEMVNLDSTVRLAMIGYIETRRSVIEETTLRSYNQVLQHRFQDIMDVPLIDLKPMQIQQSVNLEAQQVSPKTLKNAYGLLRSVLKMYDVDVNLNNIKLPKVRRKEKELPTFETLFPIIKGTSVELPVLLAAWLSLRIGEVIGLQFKDVDMKKRTIMVRRTIINTEDGAKVREGCKTEKSTRRLELPKYIFDLITAIPHESDDEFIVKLTSKALYNRFRRLMEKHDIHITFHDLRHLNASIMLMLGVPNKYACERGGWSTDNILKSVYQQTFSSERKKIDKLIDGYFDGVIRDTSNSTHPSETT